MNTLFFIVILFFAIFGWRFLTAYLTWKLDRKKERKGLAPFGWGFIGGLAPVLGMLIVPHRAQDENQPYRRITGKFVYHSPLLLVMLFGIAIIAEDGGGTGALAFVGSGALVLATYVLRMSYEFLKRILRSKKVLSFSTEEVAKVNYLVKGSQSEKLRFLVKELQNEGTGCRLLRIEAVSDQGQIGYFSITKLGNGTFTVKYALADGTLVVTHTKSALADALQQVAEDAEKQGAFA